MYGSMYSSTSGVRSAGAPNSDYGEVYEHQASLEPGHRFVEAFCCE
jgi:hypothetical protein